MDFTIIEKYFKTLKENKCKSKTKEKQAYKSLKVNFFVFILKAIFIFK